MNLRNEMYPIKNKLISNESNTVWIVTEYNYDKIISYIKSSYPRVNYSCVMDFIHSNKKYNILIALPIEGNLTIRWCTSHPSKCGAITVNYYPCNECVKLRKQYE